MPVFLDSNDETFEDDFRHLLSMKREDSPDVDRAVAEIIEDVRTRGDAAVVDLTKRFDRFDITSDTLRISDAEIKEHISKVSHQERQALELAASRIRSYHEKQLPEDRRWREPNGAELGWRWTPVSAAGLYVPGGIASYPSSVLMISGVSEIYRIGGAQAIAALAYGTDSIPPVDKITGPGNAYVAAAKRRVFGKVGIDMIAGPSEILVIADGANDPDWIALDLLSQAEHDESAQSILITTDAEFANSVCIAVDARLKTLERAAIAKASWDNFGAVITVPSLEVAAKLSDRIAPEHLELCVADPDALAQHITHAGAIFLGAWTPEAIGDYVGGPNHVLPTARSARFSSGLSVLDFMKRTTLAAMSADALRKIGPAAEILARSESLEAHGLSVTARLRKLN
ncbi:MAG: histidinol dehydrogenase [Rhodobacteraceae bacterium]|nr:histidinol dehydrogenase [Paracoccaceae bacterium]